MRGNPPDLGGGFLSFLYFSILRGTKATPCLLGTGLEPACLAAYAPQAYVSADFTTRARTAIRTLPCHRPWDYLTILARSQQDKIFLEYGRGMVHGASVV